MLVIVVWAVTGPVFHWSDTWQLIVNTGTTIITFLMVFLIQSTQNRDAVAVQVKLDELLRISAGAHNVLMDLEELEEDELERIRAVYTRLAEEARRGVNPASATRASRKSASSRVGRLRRANHATPRLHRALDATLQLPWAAAHCLHENHHALTISHAALAAALLLTAAGCETVKTTSAGAVGVKRKQQMLVGQQDHRRGRRAGLRNRAQDRARKGRARTPTRRNWSASRVSPSASWR